MNCAILKVDQNHRVFLPETDLKGAGWVLGDVPLRGWLLVGGPGRCRLLSSAEFDGDPSCLSLRAAIDAAIGNPVKNAIEFPDEASAALSLRLFAIEVAPPGPGWRLTLPRPLAAIMQIRPKESSVALLHFQKYLEIWTLEALRASLAVPLAEMI
jgi:hypothetical protein